MRKLVSFSRIMVLGLMVSMLGASFAFAEDHPPPADIKSPLTDEQKACFTNNGAQPPAPGVRRASEETMVNVRKCMQALSK